MKVFLIFIGCLMSFICFAQDKINLLNGKVFSGRLVNISDSGVEFVEVKKSGKESKIHLYDRYRVFSYVKSSDNKEIIIYEPDSLTGNTMSRNQMRMYILGEQDATQNFKTLKHFSMSFGLTLGVSLYDTYLFGGNDYICDGNTVHVDAGMFRRSPSIMQILTPIMLTSAAALIKSRIQRKHVSDITYLANEKYSEGFYRIQKSKRIFSVLKGAALGTVVGLVSYNLYKLDPCSM